MPRGRTPRSAIASLAREREQQAFELRKSGKTYDEIAKLITKNADGSCVTKQAVYSMVKRVIDGLVSETRETATEVIAMELERLDSVLLPMLELARDGDLGAVDRVLRIMERRAKLLGLDAPTQSKVTQEVTIGPDYKRLSNEELETMIAIEEKALDKPEAT